MPSRDPTGNFRLRFTLLHFSASSYIRACSSSWSKSKQALFPPTPHPNPSQRDRELELKNKLCFTRGRGREGEKGGGGGGDTHRERRGALKLKAIPTYIRWSWTRMSQYQGCEITEHSQWKGQSMCTRREIRGWGARGGGGAKESGLLINGLQRPVNRTGSPQDDQTVISNAHFETLFTLGAGIAQRLERRTRDWKVAGSNPCWSGGRTFFSRVDFLCWLLFRYLFHPRVTAVARKRSRSFCQKCRWQVTAKHTYT